MTGDLPVPAPERPDTETLTARLPGEAEAPG